MVLLYIYIIVFYTRPESPRDKMSRFRRLSGDVPALFEAYKARVIFLLYHSLLCMSLFMAGWACGASWDGMMVNKAMWRRFSPCRHT